MGSIPGTVRCPMSKERIVCVNFIVGALVDVVNSIQSSGFVIQFRSCGRNGTSTVLRKGQPSVLLPFLIISSDLAKDGLFSLACLFNGHPTVEPVPNLT